MSGVLVGLAGIVTPALVRQRCREPWHRSISYQLGWVTNTEFAGTYLAQTQGYDAANGLKVTILPGGSDPVEPVVASGKALVGDSNADIVAAAVAAGAQLRIIGAKYQINPFCIISSASARSRIRKS
jgi:ABC-type nitrate/sulfonate/bicarbonate transport system substrate-binding protein